jgi:hypothetical protein
MSRAAQYWPWRADAPVSPARDLPRMKKPPLEGLILNSASRPWMVEFKDSTNRSQRCTSESNAGGLQPVVTRPNFGAVR